MVISLLLKWLLWILAFEVLASSAFAGWYYYYLPSQEPASSESTPAASEEADSTPAETTTTETEEDPYAGWNTYTNTEIGYQLKYPVGWTVDEVDLVSEVTGDPVKYVKVSTANNWYFLHFGLKRPTDTYSLSDRTGVGAGDFQAVSGTTWEILDVTPNVEQLTYLSKIKEVFYKQPSGSDATCDCNFSATFSYNGDLVDYDTLDMTGLADEATAQLILQSVIWLP